MSGAILIYMPLLNEGTEAWRLVRATPLADGRYVILGPMPEHEEWVFAPGAIVYGKLKTFSDGEQGVVTVGNPS